MKNDPLKISGMQHGATPSVFKNAASLRNNMTKPEIKVQQYLKTKPKGFKFRRQHPIAWYVLDFYCHKLRFSIEIDGGYHLNIEQQEKDAERTAYLNEIGITEIRFTNKNVLENFKEIIDKIDTYLSAEFPSGNEGER